MGIYRLCMQNEFPTQAKCCDHKGAAGRVLLEPTGLYCKSAARLIINSVRASNAARQSSLQKQPEFERRTQDAHSRNGRRGEATAWRELLVNC